YPVRNRSLLTSPCDRTGMGRRRGMSDMTTTTSTQAPSTATAPSSSPTPPPSVGFWRRLARAFLSLWWIFVVALVGGAAAYLGHLAGPALLPFLPRTLTWARSQSLLAVVALALAVVTLLAGMAWLTYLAWRRSEQQAVEEVEASITQQGAAFAQVL